MNQIVQEATAPPNLDEPMSVETGLRREWRREAIAEDLRRLLNLNLPVAEWGREEGIDETGIRERIEAAAEAHMAAKMANMGPEIMRFVEKSLLLQTLDAVWKEHLLALAKKLDVSGRSTMKKKELVDAIQKANDKQTAKARKKK